MGPQILFYFFLFLQNLHKKMTQAQFIENLSGLCDEKDFPKDLLKVIKIVVGSTHEYKNNVNHSFILL